VSVVRQAALEALAADVAQVLDGDVHEVLVGEQDPEKQPCFPNVVVRAVGAFTFEPFDDDEIETAGNHLVDHVGDFTGKVEIRIGARTPAEREAFGERVLHRFLSQQGRRGVLVLQLPGLEINGYTLATDVPVAFCLDQDGWNDEMVFDKKRYQYLELAVDLPALVNRFPVYDINQLVTAFTEDLTSEDPTTEQVEVTDTGALEGYP
jgi:hypothetical protein